MTLVRLCRLSMRDRRPLLVLKLPSGDEDPLVVNAIAAHHEELAIVSIYSPLVMVAYRYLPLVFRSTA